MPPVALGATTTQAWCPSKAKKAGGTSVLPGTHGGPNEIDLGFMALTTVTHDKVNCVADSNDKCYEKE